MSWLFGHVVDFVLYTVPWWVWLALGAGLVLFVWRMLGTKAAIALAVAVGLAVVDRRGRQLGAKREIDKAKAERQAAVERRLKINKDVAGRTEEKVREDLKKYVRKESKP